MASKTEWWRDAVVYQVYPRSFKDSNSDGIGDLPGIISQLDHFTHLGVDALWLSPFYPSPQLDAGYDVANYRDVDPLFGSLADADALIAGAHARGLKVVIDLVPNHTSHDHPWFRAALAAGPGSPERARYYFRPGRNGGAQPPNDWRSVFGGSAWTRVRDRADAPGSPWQDDDEWYLNLFDSSQPDLNWANPEVGDEFESILRFWLERGVDGFRVDVAHALVKDPALPDWDGQANMVDGTEGTKYTCDSPMWDQDGVHDIYRRWRRVLDEYEGDRMLVAEAWVEPLARLADYVRADEMHQAFNFSFLVCEFTPAALRADITKSLAANAAVGAPTTWVLSNHDVMRHATRLGLDREYYGANPNGIEAGMPQPDAALGLQKARAATLLMLALPGGAYVYQGEEFGLPDHTELPRSVRQDPAFFRTNGAELGRDGCRVPLPWDSTAPGLGFSPTGQTWLPQPPVYAQLARDKQVDEPDSTYEMYRAALAARRALRLGRGHLEWLETGSEALAFVNHSADGELLCFTAFAAPSALPDGWTVLAQSGPLAAGQLPPYTTVWARRDA